MKMVVRPFELRLKITAAAALGLGKAVSVAKMSNFGSLPGTNLSCDKQIEQDNQRSLCA
jgi:hypothetical protein